MFFFFPLKVDPELVNCCHRLYETLHRHYVTLILKIVKNINKDLNR